MGYFYIESKPDDYDARITQVVYCKESQLKKVYFYKEVPNYDIYIVKKYIDFEEDRKEVKELIKKCSV